MKTYKSSDINRLVEFFDDDKRFDYEEVGTIDILSIRFLLGSHG